MLVEPIKPASTVGMAQLLVEQDAAIEQADIDRPSLDRGSA